MQTTWIALPALVAGLASSVHCVGMCGGIVGALNGAAAGTGRASLAWLQVCYGLGRIASYSVAGAAVGAAGAAGALALGWRGEAYAQSVFAAIAALMLVAIGLYLAGLLPGLARLERTGLVLWRYLEPRARRLLPVRTPVQALSLGALWGFLPCGLVYTMLVTAAAAGGATAGATVMAAFGLGTLPALLAVGLWFGRFDALVRRRGARMAAGLAVAAFGLYGLVALGASLLSGTDPHANHRHGGVPALQAVRA